MIRIVPRLGWSVGRYLVVASSAQAQLEWSVFAKKYPQAAQKAYERLSNYPLERQPRRQFPLRGKFFSPFWELEASSSERIWYAVDEIGFITIVAAREDVHSSAKLADMLKARRTAYESAVAEVLRVAIRDTIDAPLRVPEWALKPD